MKNPFLIVSVVIFIAVLMFAGFVKLNHKNPTATINLNDAIINEDGTGITVNTLSSGQVIQSPLKITGKVSGGGWTGFEGQVGVVKLQDEAGKELAVGILTATTEWTQLPTNFETTLHFNSGSATSGRLIFHNENASGDLERDKTYVIPIKFK